MYTPKVKYKKDNHISYQPYIKTKSIMQTEFTTTDKQESVEEIVSAVKNKKFNHKEEIKHIFSLPKDQKERALELIKSEGTMAASSYVIDKYMGADKISIRDYVLELSKQIKE